MGCFDECLEGMMEPYGGNTPLWSADKTDATVTIVQEAYDDGMKVTRIQTPPRTETSKLMEAINSILGMFGDECLSLDKFSKNDEPDSNGKKDQKKDISEKEGGDKDEKTDRGSRPPMRGQRMEDEDEEASS